MTYRWNLAKIVRATGKETPQQWAYTTVQAVSALISTARLALENDNCGYSSDAERIAVCADTLEVAQAFLAIVDEGTELLSREVGAGIWDKDEAQTFPESPAGSQS